MGTAAKDSGDGLDPMPTAVASNLWPLQLSGENTQAWFMGESASYFALSIKGTAAISQHES